MNCLGAPLLETDVGFVLIILVLGLELPLFLRASKEDASSPFDLTAAPTPTPRRIFPVINSPSPEKKGEYSKEFLLHLNVEGFIQNPSATFPENQAFVRSVLVATRNAAVIAAKVIRCIAGTRGQCLPSRFLAGNV